MMIASAVRLIYTDVARLHYLFACHSILYNNNNPLLTIKLKNNIAKLYFIAHFCCINNCCSPFFLMTTASTVRLISLQQKLRTQYEYSECY